MSTRDERLVRFRQQFNEIIDSQKETDPKCTFAAGMLLILSAMRRYDGPSLPMQVAEMHSVLLEIGRERGWVVVGQG
jgi:hypothetical protein